jgi:ABC-type uncharacterized transport system ATPase subunit
LVVVVLVDQTQETTVLLVVAVLEDIDLLCQRVLVVLHHLQRVN